MESPPMTPIERGFLWGLVIIHLIGGTLGWIALIRELLS